MAEFTVKVDPPSDGSVQQDTRAVLGTFFGNTFSIEKIMSDAVDMGIREKNGDAQAYLQSFRQDITEQYNKGEISPSLAAHMTNFIDEAAKAENPADAIKASLTRDYDYMLSEQEKWQDEKRKREAQAELDRETRRMNERAEAERNAGKHPTSTPDAAGDKQMNPMAAKLLELIVGVFSGQGFDKEKFAEIQRSLKESMQEAMEKAKAAKPGAEADGRTQTNSPSRPVAAQENLDKQLLVFKNSLSPEQLALFVKPERPSAPTQVNGEMMGYYLPAFEEEGRKWDEAEVKFSQSLNPEQLVAWNKIKSAQSELHQAQIKSELPEGPTTYSDPKTAAATNGQPAPEGQRADRFNGMAADTSQTTAQRVDPKVEVPAVVAAAPVANDPAFKVADMRA